MVALEPEPLAGLRGQWVGGPRSGSFTRSFIHSQQRNVLGVRRERLQRTRRLPSRPRRRIRLRPAPGSWKTSGEKDTYKPYSFAEQKCGRREARPRTQGPQSEERPPGRARQGRGPRGPGCERADSDQEEALQVEGPAGTGAGAERLQR